MAMHLRQQLLASTFFCGTLMMAGTAQAQDQRQDAQPQSGPVEAANPANAASADAQPSDQGAIVITGSRIPQPNLTSVSPVTVINSQEVRLSGTTRTEDLINALPQVTASQAGNLSNGSTGTATVNLRNLGTNRTLVLINGRRLVPGDPSPGGNAPDLNFVPATMIERVDVLTGGASSVYGADAVAGVVNFVMNTNFEGLRLDGQYSFYNHDNNTGSGLIPALNGRGFGYPKGPVADGGTIDASAQIGAAFDDGRGHVVAYGTYRRMDAVTQNKRDYSACVAQSAAGTNNLICGGSLTAANASVNFFRNGASTTFQVGPGRTLTANLTRFNFAPTNYYQRPDERYTLGFFANYEISESLRPYLEGMFMDDRTVAQIAPSGDFGNTYAVNCDNPLLGAQQRSLLCATGNLLTTPDLMGVYPGTVSQPDPTDCAARGQVACTTPFTFVDPSTGKPYNKGFANILRRNVEGGGRRDDREHEDFRIVAGMRGDLGKAWSYDSYYQFGQVNFSETYLNELSITRLRNALDVVTNPATGQPVCRSVLTGADPSCVPYDVWGIATINPAALTYLQTPGFQRGSNKESVFNFSLTGKLGDYGVRFPWAENGVGIALGLEYRKESLELSTDAEFSLLPASDLAGQGAPTLSTSGAFDVREAFAELRIPIVENGFIQNLSLEGGYRHSHYNVIGTGHTYSTDTYKIGGDFAPVRDVRFRGSYNRAVRAPNIQELFAPSRVQLDGATDPCAGHVIQASEAGCIAQGLHAGQTVAPNPAAQYNGQVGGSLNLTPEVADTYTVGVVLQPRFVPRLAITVDWYDIRIKNAIQQIGADTILATCINTANPLFCGLIHRDASGSIWRSAAGFVMDNPRNIGGFSTRGIDVGASYAMNIGRWGGLSFNMQGTWLDKLIVNTGISAPFNCAGLYGPICSGGGSLTGPNPKWRHKARLTWNAPDGIGLSLQWRYLGAVSVDKSSTQPGLAGAFSPRDARIPAQSYFDLALTAKIGDHYQFRLGINNILDKEPPIFGSNGGLSECPANFCNGNTFPGTYDALGRYIFAGVTLDF
ncbi:MAG TPA: TonB-dependent receptor [Allosphingosinicella sp.]|jgi:outer membrane receptor protein involved in Fe transport|nr:TonB-dependent receptor [Allosphingosinicella sp.]